MEQFMSDFARGLAGSAGVALENFIAFFLALVLAAPAMAWIAYLPVERRISIVAQSHLAGIQAGISLTLLSSLGLALVSRFLNDWIADEYRWKLSAPYVAIVLVLVAIGVQLSAWSSLSSQRAAGLAAAALTLFAIVAALKLQ